MSDDGDDDGRRLSIRFWAGVVLLVLLVAVYVVLAGSMRNPFR